MHPIDYNELKCHYTTETQGNTDLDCEQSNIDQERVIMYSQRAFSMTTTCLSLFAYFFKQKSVIQQTPI